MNYWTDNRLNSPGNILHIDGQITKKATGQHNADFGGLCPTYDLVNPDNADVREIA